MIFGEFWITIHFFHQCTTHIVGDFLCPNNKNISPPRVACEFLELGPPCPETALFICAVKNTVCTKTTYHWQPGFHSLKPQTCWWQAWDVPLTGQSLSGTEREERSQTERQSEAHQSITIKELLHMLKTLLLYSALTSFWQDGGPVDCDVLKDYRCAFHYNPQTSHQGTPGQHQVTRRWV